jgi:citrate lyase beta subunit
MYPKAARAGADIVTIDLEDAVAPQHKDQARSDTLSLSENFVSPNEVETIVRINCLRTPEGLADLQGIIDAKHPPPALMLPKVKSAAEIAVHEELLSGPLSHIRFHIIIETNEGLESCFEIARCSNRIDSLLFGGVDMAAELRVEPTWGPLLYARSRAVHAAAGAGLDFIDVPFLDLDDMDGLSTEAQACVQLGMTGKAAIHPKQIAVINRHFTPSAEEIARARRIIEAFENGDSGLVVIDNKLIEKPVLRSMYRILAIAGRLGL